jgi:hypothetical protein
LWFAGAGAAVAKNESPSPLTPLDSHAARRPGGEGKRKQKQKNDPKHVAMARELRDRYLEEVNSGRLLAAPPESAKYEVGRAISAPTRRSAIIDERSAMSETHPLPHSLRGRGNLLPLLEAA